MPAIVVDCGAFMACVLLDEEPPKGLPERLGEAEFAVPAIWPIEVANALLMALRKKRADEAAMQIIRRSLKARSIEVEPGRVDLALSSTLALAAEYKLTAYDAAYLELALRRDLPLATLDSDLRRAAKKAGVALA